MIDIETIKIKVLDLAMRGKLSKHEPGDVGAEDLYRIIQEETLVKSKIKKKKESVITEEEIPFEIPDNWKWVHLNDIATSMLGKTLNKSTDKGEICPYLCSINVYWDGINLENVKKAKFDELSKEKYRLKKGDLLICEGGDSGRSAVWNEEEEMYYQNALHRVRFLGGVNPYFFCYVFEYYKKTGMIARYTTGIGIQHLVQNSLNLIWLPLPPVAEQVRIIEQIEAIFGILDEIDALQEQYAFNQEALKRKLIDVAIQGKLTEQLPEDGTAEDLYNTICEEKKNLINEGKLKKAKPLPVIQSEEIPSEIPDNWIWVRLSDVIDVRDGTHDSPKYHDEGIPLVTSKNISSGELCFDDVKLISEADANKINERSYVDDGDILFAMIGSIGNPVIVHKDREFCIKNVALFKNFAPRCISMQYVYWYLMHEQYVLRKNAIGGLQPFVSLKVFRNHLMPLPPFDEQERISNRLYELIHIVSEK